MTFKSGNTLDRAMDTVLGYELPKLNTHPPKQRPSLRELLLVEDPTVEAADGLAIVLKKSELQELANIVPAEYHGR